jgi:hypothetical protein
LFLRSDFVHEDFASMVYVMREYCGGADFVIRQWAEARNAAPATAGESGQGNGIGVLRMCPANGFPWLWRQAAQESQLVFLFQEHKADGSPSIFFRLNRLG